MFYYLVASAIESGQFMTDKGEITNTYAEIYENTRKKEALKYFEEVLKNLIQNARELQDKKAGSVITLLGTLENEDSEELKELLLRVEIHESGAIGLGGNSDYIRQYTRLIEKYALLSGYYVANEPQNLEQEHDKRRLLEPYKFDA